ncbi:SGNH/GDSL hydrolase family protein [Thermodesulfobacteriota bacterium]
MKKGNRVGNRVIDGNLMPSSLISVGRQKLKKIQVPLVIDLMDQRTVLAGFLIKLAVFLAIFVLSDQMIGGLLHVGLKRYFGLNVPAAVLCIGHSHTVLGIDKIELEKQLHVPVAKYARQGANASDRLVMIRHYLSTQPDAVRIIVYGVNANTFTREGLSKNSYRLFYPFMDTPSIRDYVKENVSSSGEYWLRRYMKLPRFNEVTLALSIRGWLSKWTNLKHGRIDIKKLRKMLSQGDFRKITFDKKQVDLFEETIRLVRSHNIRLVLVYIPTIDILNEAEPEKYREAIRKFAAYAAKDTGISFLNYNAEFSDRHDLFYDPIHLNPHGQKIITGRLSKDLKKLMQIKK